MCAIFYKRLYMNHPPLKMRRTNTTFFHSHGLTERIKEKAVCGMVYVRIPRFTILVLKVYTANSTQLHNDTLLRHLAAFISSHTQGNTLII
jgi:hypothetical protein